jgi:glutamyl-tRNA synthetase
VTVRTRFAPSPTGDLHLGGAWTALASWVVARRAPWSSDATNASDASLRRVDAPDASLLRIEDLDAPRVAAGARERIEEDLRWLGLDWDEAPVLQSTRSSLYAQAIDTLAGRGLVYPCDCSRAELARAASAPHEGEEAVYPGFCRDRDPSRAMKRPPALRAHVPDASVSYEDGAIGPVTQNLARDVGDFVLRRGDGVYAYQLAVVVDDAAMGITDVVRGADLVASTPRQIWLARALGLTPPRYAHVPLVVAPDGSRLEKRTKGATVRGLREAGVSARAIVGALAHGLGLAPRGVPASAIDIATTSARRPIEWSRDPWPIPNEW